MKFAVSAEQTLLKIFVSDLYFGPKKTLMENLRKRASPTKSKASDLVIAWLPFVQSDKYQDGRPEYFQSA